MIRRLKNSKGFTLVEAVLGLVMGAMVLGVTSQTLLNNMDSYTFVANRKSALGDARYAMDRMSYELLRVDSADLVAIEPTRIRFTDDTGTLTSFRLGTNGDTLALFRDTDLLVDKISSFALTYLDNDGNTVAPDAVNIPQVKRIKITLTTEEVDDEGQITLSTTVTPRVFIGYSNYQ
jgi:hypothetical protein